LALGREVARLETVARRSKKAPPTDPDSAGLESVEQADADEARILREIEGSDAAQAVRPRPPKTPSGKRKHKGS